MRQYEWHVNEIEKNEAVKLHVHLPAEIIFFFYKCWKESSLSMLGRVVLVVAIAAVPGTE
jgi:hypothetical protein